MTEDTNSISPVDKGALALKNAGQVLLVYAFFVTLAVGVGLALSGGETDGLGKAIAGALCALIFLLVLAGTLILKRRRAGVILWWILSPMILLSFPVGTATGVYVIVSLAKPESKQALKNRA